MSEEDSFVVLNTSITFRNSSSIVYSEIPFKKGARGVFYCQNRQTCQCFANLKPNKQHFIFYKHQTLENHSSACTEKQKLQKPENEKNEENQKQELEANHSEQELDEPLETKEKIVISPNNLNGDIFKQIIYVMKKGGKKNYSNKEISNLLIELLNVHKRDLSHFLNSKREPKLFERMETKPLTFCYIEEMVQFEEEIILETQEESLVIPEESQPETVQAKDVYIEPKFVEIVKKNHFTIKGFEFEKNNDQRLYFSCVNADALGCGSKLKVYNNNYRFIPHSKSTLTECKCSSALLEIEDEEILYSPIVDDSTNQDTTDLSNKMETDDPIIHSTELVESIQKEKLIINPQNFLNLEEKIIFLIMKKGNVRMTKNDVDDLFENFFGNVDNEISYIEKILTKSSFIVKLNTLPITYKIRDELVSFNPLIAESLLEKLIYIVKGSINPLSIKEIQSLFVKKFSEKMSTENIQKILEERKNHFIEESEKYTYNKDVPPILEIDGSNLITLYEKIFHFIHTTHQLPLTQILIFESLEPSLKFTSFNYYFNMKRDFYFKNKKLFSLDEAFFSFTNISEGPKETKEKKPNPVTIIPLPPNQYSQEVDSEENFEIDEYVYALFNKILYGGKIMEIRGDGSYFIHYYGYNKASDEWVNKSRLRKVKDLEIFMEQKECKKLITRTPDYEKNLKSISTSKQPYKDEGIDPEIETIEVECDVPYSTHISILKDHLIILNKSGEISICDMLDPLLKKYTLDQRVDSKFFSIMENGTIYTIDSKEGVLQSSSIDLNERKLIDFKNISTIGAYENTKFLMNQSQDLYTIEFEALYHISLNTDFSEYTTISEISDQWNSIKLATIHDDMIYLIDEAGDLFKIDLSSNVRFFKIGNPYGFKNSFKKFTSIQSFEGILYGIEEESLVAIHPDSGNMKTLQSGFKNVVAFVIDSKGHVWMVDDSEDILHYDIDKIQMISFKKETTKKKKQIDYNDSNGIVLSNEVDDVCKTTPKKRGRKKKTIELDSNGKNTRKLSPKNKTIESDSEEISATIPKILEVDSTPKKRGPKKIIIESDSEEIPVLTPKKRVTKKKISEEEVSTPKKKRKTNESGEPTSRKSKGHQLMVDDFPEILEEIRSAEVVKVNGKERMDKNFKVIPIIRDRYPDFFNPDKPIKRKLIKVSNRIKSNQVKIKHLIFLGHEFNIPGYCHHCGDCGSLLICQNFEKNKCRKVICSRCCLKMMTREEYEKILYNEDEKFICTHCSKNCPDSASCQRNKRLNAAKSLLKNPEDNSLVGIDRKNIIKSKRRRKRKKEDSSESDSDLDDDSDVSDMDEYDFPFEDDESVRMDKLVKRKEKAMALAHFIISLVPKALEVTSVRDPDGIKARELEPNTLDLSYYDTWGNKTEKFVEDPDFL
jgi:hypothetical protein